MRVNRPWRSAIAAVELGLAAVLVVLAVGWWAHGLVEVGAPGGTMLTHTVGGWLAAAVGAVTLAGLLVLDSARNTLLALYVRSAKPA